MSIRPVSRRLPSSSAVWEETNLPMCVVVTPLEGILADSEEDAYSHVGDRTTTAGTNVTTGIVGDDDFDVLLKNFAQPISAVPKCLHCGAPHPTSATHFRPSGKLSTRILCYFCGETSSTLLTDQQDVRVGEYLDPNTYDKLSFEKEKQVVLVAHVEDAEKKMSKKDMKKEKKKEEIFSDSDDEEDSEEGSDEDSDESESDDDTKKKKSKKDTKKDRKKNKKPEPLSESEDSYVGSDSVDNEKEEEQVYKTDCLEFRVPIDVKKVRTKVLKPKKKKKKKSKDKKARSRRKLEDEMEDNDEYNYETNTISTWQLPAMSCPPVWWIIVDGTVGDGTVPGQNYSSSAVKNYWNTVGSSLTKTLEEIPPHVHVGLITATKSKLACWDLTSAIPHVNQYPYSYDPTTAGGVPQLLLLKDNTTSGGKVENDTDSDSEDEDDGLLSWDLCLVPANASYKANIEAAIRAMADGAISGAFKDKKGSSSCSKNGNKNNDASDSDSDSDSSDSDDSYSIIKKVGEADADEEEEGCFDTSGIPLGLTLEIILEFMEQANHPGQDNKTDTEDDDEKKEESDGNSSDSDVDSSDSDDDSEDGYGNNKKKKTATKTMPTPAELRYAGGKILCILGNAPLETALPATAADDTGDDTSVIANAQTEIHQPKFYQGGVAGACFEPEESKKEKKKKKPKKKPKKKKKSKKHDSDEEESDQDEEDKDKNRDVTDMTSSNLQDYTVPLYPDDLFVTIGKRCAQAALGVDLFVLVPEEDHINTKDADVADPSDKKKSSKKKRKEQQEQLQPHKQRIPWYGLPLLRPLTESSGSPGPLMFGTANTIPFSGSENDEDYDHDDDSLHLKRICENLISRTPWQAGMAFGAQMRLRLSPGFSIDTTPVEIEEDEEGGMQLAPFLSSRGLAGPATALLPEDNDDDGNNDNDGMEDSGLWIMGTCDPHTSFTIDFEMAARDGEIVKATDDEDDQGQEIPDCTEMEGFGIVSLKPVMQTCTLFTCVETDDAEPVPNYYTVCKMRVTSVSLPLANDAESIYDALDPEALSAVLYQKIALDSYLTGFLDAQTTAEEWIHTFMVGLYHSASQKQELIEEEKEEARQKHKRLRKEEKERKRELERQREEEEKELQRKRAARSKKKKKVVVKVESDSSSSESDSESDDSDYEEEEKNDETKEIDITKFVARDRLLPDDEDDDEEGEGLNEEDILMGQGHFKANVVPLLIYAIMQSDALRPCVDGKNKFNPSMDARLCAMTQMSSMLPKPLAKCFAPSLSLWSLRDDMPIIDSLPLSYDGILDAIEDLTYYGDGNKKSTTTKPFDDEDAILLMDSPQKVILYRWSDLKNAKINDDDDDDSKSEDVKRSLKPVKIGPELESAIVSGLHGFRTPPPQKNDLEKLLEQNKKAAVPLDLIQVSSFQFLSMLLEDTPTASGADKDFLAWKSKIAQLVRDDVEVDEHDEETNPALSGFRRFLPFGRK